MAFQLDSEEDKRRALAMSILGDQSGMAGPIPAGMDMDAPPPPRLAEPEAMDFVKAPMAIGTAPGLDPMTRDQRMAALIGSAAKRHQANAPDMSFSLPETQGEQAPDMSFSPGGAGIRPDMTPPPASFTPQTAASVSAAPPAVAALAAPTPPPGPPRGIVGQLAAPGGVARSRQPPARVGRPDRPAQAPAGAPAQPDRQSEVMNVLGSIFPGLFKGYAKRAGEERAFDRRQQTTQQAAQTAQQKADLQWERGQEGRELTREKGEAWRVDRGVLEKARTDTAAASTEQRDPQGAASEKARATLRATNPAYYRYLESKNPGYLDNLSAADKESWALVNAGAKKYKPPGRGRGGASSRVSSAASQAYAKGDVDALLAIQGTAGPKQAKEIGGMVRKLADQQRTGERQETTALRTEKFKQAHVERKNARDDKKRLEDQMQKYANDTMMFQGLQTNMNIINTLIRDVTDPQTGEVGDIPGQGMIESRLGTSWLAGAQSDKALKMQAAVDSAVTTILRLESGAAISKPEAETYKNLLSGVKNANTEREFLSRWNNFNAVIGSKRRALRAGRGKAAAAVDAAAQMEERADIVIVGEAAAASAPAEQPSMPTATNAAGETVQYVDGQWVAM